MRPMLPRSLFQSPCCHPGMRIKPRSPSTRRLSRSSIKLSGSTTRSTAGWLPGTYFVEDQIAPGPHSLIVVSSNLEDAHVKAEYERGYKLLLDFFHEHL